MNIAVILFVYHRYEKTLETVRAVEKNIVLPELLYIFQDGVSETTDIDEWNKVNELINSISFCRTEIHVSKVNNGLAKSLKSGISYVMDRNDAAIILEDDCVSHPLFIDYATKALLKYQDKKTVWSINGHSEKSFRDNNGTDAYFIGRASSWGWATWRDRWNYYEEDYKLLDKIKKDPEKKQQFDIWGEDLENYLYGNIEGRCDSWAVFWCLQIIYRGGYCLTPYKSLIRNIGTDGTGRHRVNIKLESHERSLTDDSMIKLPEIIEFPNSYEKIFMEDYHWISPNYKNRLYKNLLIEWFQKDEAHVQNVLLAKGYKRISIWGTGDIAKILIKQIENKIKIVEVIKSKDSNNEQIFCGYGICDYSKMAIDSDVDAIVVVPFYEVDLIKNKIKRDNIDVIVLGLDRLIAN